MAKQSIRMLTAIAGADFSYAHGDVVSVEGEVAKAWIEASMADEPPKAAVVEKAAKDAVARVAELEGALAESQADHKAVKDQAEQLAARVVELEAKLAAVPVAA